MGGARDADVKHDTATAGEFTPPLRPLHAASLSHSSPRGSCSRWHAANLATSAVCLPLGVRVRACVRASESECFYFIALALLLESFLGQVTVRLFPF